MRTETDIGTAKAIYAPFPDADEVNQLHSARITINIFSFNGHMTFLL